MIAPIRLSDYSWGGMLSIWGQGDKAWQGVCYSGLCYKPYDYIKDISKDGAPVEMYMLRYVDLELANNWLNFLINHVLPEEVLKHIKFQRLHTKGLWPKTFMNKVDAEEMLDFVDYDDEDDDEVRIERMHQLAQKKYGGCSPWLKVSFDQQLPSHVIFAVGVLLRYASEHGPVLKLIEQMPIIGSDIPVKNWLSIATNIGGARGHALGTWSYGYLEKFRSMSEKFNWKKRFADLLSALPPFYEVPQKETNVDQYFSVQWNVGSGQRTELTTSSYNTNTLVRNDVHIVTRHSKPTELMNLWAEKAK